MVSRGLERWLRSKAFDIKTEISEFKSQVPVKTLVNYGDPFVITLSRLSLSEMITRTKQLAKLPDRRVWGSKRDLALIYKMDSHCRRLLGQPLPLHAFIYTHTHAHSHIYIYKHHLQIRVQTKQWSEKLLKRLAPQSLQEHGGPSSESRERESDLQRVSHKGNKQMFLNMQGLRKYNS